MTDIGPTSWFLVLFSFSVMAIAIFIIRSYANKYRDIKDQIHTIHAFIELIDESLEDDKVTKEEFVALVKRVLAVLAGIK
jgi:hypothetical protein